MLTQEGVGQCFGSSYLGPDRNMYMAFSVDRYLDSLYSATNVSLPQNTQGLLSRALVWIMDRA